MTIVRTALFVLCLVFTSLPVWADTLVLDSGRRMEGEIVEESADLVVFRLTGGAQITLPRAGIREIERSSAGDVSLMKGDSLFERGEFAEAMDAYREALKANPEAARKGIKAIQEALAERIHERLDGLTPDEAEEVLREELEDLAPGDPSLFPLQAGLARILTKKGKDTFKYMQYDKSLAYFEEAWDLAPHTPGLGPGYAEMLKRGRAPASEILSVLRIYVAGNPDDIEAIAELAAQVWERNPWEAFDLLCPGGEPREGFTESMKEVLPMVLRACFDSVPYPADAPIGRVACYEWYLELAPEADKIPLYEARFESDPENPQHLYDWGVYLAEMDRPAEAIEVFQDLLATTPGFSDAKTRVKDLDRAILDRRLRKEEQQVQKLEAVLRRAANLTRRDFPLLQEGPGLGRLLAEKERIAEFLAKSPSLGSSGSGADYLADLREYASFLSDATMNARARYLLAHNPESGVVLKRGDLAPDFEGNSPAGKRIRLSDYRGKVVLLYFWASWCPACRADMKNLTQMLDPFYPAKIRVVGVSFDRNRDDLKEYLRSNRKIGWPQVYAGTERMTEYAKVYGAGGIPSILLLDSKGRIRYDGKNRMQLMTEIMRLVE